MFFTDLKKKDFTDKEENINKRKSNANLLNTNINVQNQSRSRRKSSTSLKPENFYEFEILNDYLDGRNIEDNEFKPRFERDLEDIIHESELLKYYNNGNVEYKFLDIKYLIKYLTQLLIDTCEIYKRSIKSYQLIFNSKPLKSVFEYFYLVGGEKTIRFLQKNFSLKY
jgi:hypothetical protein